MKTLTSRPSIPATAIAASAIGSYKIGQLTIKDIMGNVVMQSGAVPVAPTPILMRITADEIAVSDKYDVFKPNGQPYDEFAAAFPGIAITRLASMVVPGISVKETGADIAARDLGMQTDGPVTVLGAL